MVYCGYKFVKGGANVSGIYFVNYGSTLKEDYEKLEEEVKEVINATDRDNRIEELGDVLQIVCNIIKKEGISVQEVVDKNLEKHLKRNKEIGNLILAVIKGV